MTILICNAQYVILRLTLALKFVCDKRTIVKAEFKIGVAVVLRRLPLLTSWVIARSSLEGNGAAFRVFSRTSVFIYDLKGPLLALHWLTAHVIKHFTLGIYQASGYHGNMYEHQKYWNDSLTSGQPLCFYHVIHNTFGIFLMVLHELPENREHLDKSSNLVILDKIWLVPKTLSPPMQLLWLYTGS